MDISIDVTGQDAVDGLRSLQDLARRLADELTELDAAGPVGEAAGEDPAGGSGPAAT